MQTHNSFSLRSRAFANLQSVCKARQQHWCYGASAEVAVQCCILFGGHAATSPGRFSASKREFREQSKRAPRAMGVFLKMASRSCVSGCGRFLASSDGHDRCPSCLGFQHTEAALVDESCSHCGNMTMVMLRSRYLLARRGGIPLALPRYSSSGLWRTTSAQGQGDLRITVRASPSSTSPRASHSSSISHRLVFPDECAGSSDRAGPSISSGAPADDGISIAALGDELGSGEDDSAGLPDLPGRPIRRSGGGLCPTVLRRTEADRGVSSHPAPAFRCCLHPTAGYSPSVCSSPRAPSCCLHLRSSLATTAAFTMAAAWSWPQESGAARLRPCQAREAPGQVASLRRATRSLWILLFRRW